MRVNLISNPESVVTGLSRYSTTLKRHLDELGVQTAVYRPQIPIPSSVVRLGRSLGWDLNTFFSHYAIRVQPGTADLHHLTNENLATVLRFEKIKPSIVTVHAPSIYLLRSKPHLAMQAHIFQRWFDSLTAGALQRADAIIAVSNYVRNSLVDNSPGLSPERILVIPEAVDHDFFYPRAVPPAFREKYQLSSDNFYVLYVGSEQPRKNFLTLIRAFASLRSQFENIRLLKVGQPEYVEERNKANKLIDHLGLHGDVSFIGHVGHELPLFYSVSDLFVFPSRYEGFGFPPLEAMACGTAVICSNITALPEVVGDAALLFDPKDEDALTDLMVQVARSEDLRNEYSQRGLARAQGFSWAETARKTVSLYRRVLREQ